MPHVGSWHGPSSKNNGKKDFERQRIESAVFFDIDEASDKKTDLPNMLPSPEEFAEYVGKVRMMAHCVPWSQECAHTNLTGC